MAIGQRLERLGGYIRKTEEVVLALLLGTMILLSSAQIMLRNFFDSGIPWADPLLRLLVLWVGMLGAMLATHDDKHIRIDLVTRFIPAQYHRLSGFLTALVSTLVCALLAYHSTRFVYFEWQDGSEAFIGLQAWIAESILPLGFAVMAIRFAFVAVRNLRGTTA
jgi:TRAP-type C4-dicarboxylate transport system permease small subunit